MNFCSPSPTTGARDVNRLRVHVVAHQLFRQRQQETPTIAILGECIPPAPAPPVRGSLFDFTRAMRRAEGRRFTTRTRRALHRKQQARTQCPDSWTAARPQHTWSVSCPRRDTCPVSSRIGGPPSSSPSSRRKATVPVASAAACQRKNEFLTV